MRTDEAKNTILEELKGEIVATEAKLKILREYLVNFNSLFQKLNGVTGEIKAGQFQGMGIAESLRSYLLLKRRPIQVNTIVEDLSFGGADLGIPERRYRNIKITCKNNKKIFRYKPKTDTVELASTKPAVILIGAGASLKTAARKKKASNTSASQGRRKGSTVKRARSSKPLSSSAAQAQPQA